MPGVVSCSFRSPWGGAAPLSLPGFSNTNADSDLSDSLVHRETVMHFAELLVNYAEGRQAGDPPTPPVWGSCAQLGQLDERGRIVSLTPEVGAEVAERTFRNNLLLSRIFVEAVRDRADINPDCAEWQFLRRLFGVTCAEDFRIASGEFGVYPREKRAGIMGCFERYVQAGLPMCLEAKIYEGHAGANVFLHSMFPFGWGSPLCFSALPAEDTARQVERRRVKEVAAVNFCGVAFDDFCRLNLELALKLFNRAFALEPAVAQAMGEIFAHLAASPGAEVESPIGISWRELLAELAWTLSDDLLHVCMRGGLGRHEFADYLKEQAVGIPGGFANGRLFSCGDLRQFATVGSEEIALAYQLLDRAFTSDDRLCGQYGSLYSVVAEILVGHITLGAQDAFLSLPLVVGPVIDELKKQTGQDSPLVYFLHEAFNQAVAVAQQIACQDGPHAANVPMVGSGRVQMFRAALFAQQVILTLKRLSPQSSH